MNDATATMECRNGPWRFLPEGALSHEVEGVAVVSDLHLGYELSRSDLGDFLPFDSGESVRRRLTGLFRRSGCRTLVVAGDILESTSVMRHDSGILRQLSDWIRAEGVEPVFVRGNHDARGLPGFTSSFTVDGWCIRHGHEPPVGRMGGERSITGHLHPILRYGGRTWPVFLSSPQSILLPAFSADAAGSDILDPRHFPEETWCDHACIACRSDDVISFGNRRDLRTSLARMPAPAASGSSRHSRRLKGRGYRTPGGINGA